MTGARGARPFPGGLAMRKAALGLCLAVGMGMVAATPSPPAPSGSPAPAPEAKVGGDTASSRSANAPAKAKTADPAPEGPVRRRAFDGYSTEPGYRSKGKQAKPRKRSNRRHISRRVRRAHRRSKAA